ncbi:hypothetical protein TNCV_2100661 [Trichonephila clavipes]|nr:hypothetical protein TNCV_2100661 [Trichonephila clavipes]
MYAAQQKRRLSTPALESSGRGCRIVNFWQTQRTIADAVEVAINITENGGIYSNKQGLFDVGQDKVIHGLPLQIMTDILQTARPRRIS